MPETASTPSQPSSVRRVITASLVGTSLEWYVCVLLAPETSRIDLHAEPDAAAGARGRA